MNDIERYKADQASRWLDGVRSIHVRTRTLMREIDAQRSMMDGIKAVSYDSSGTRCASDDAIPNAIASMSRMVSKLCAEVDSLVAEQAAAHDVLSRLDDQEMCEILTMYYINGETWESIRTAMCCSYASIMRKRNAALVSVYDAMDPEMRDPIYRAFES